MRAQVYSAQQARSDIDAVYSMGLFDDVNILPQPAEDSTQEQPKARPSLPPSVFWTYHSMQRDKSC